MTASARLLLFAAPAALAGCAAQGPFPSLAPRAVERELAGDAGPVPPCMEEATPARPAPPPVDAMPSDAALPARIAGLEARAREGDGAFETALAAAAAAVAKAGDTGSESWIEAQQAVSRAESARSPTVAALSELNGLAVAAAERRANPADQDALRAAVLALQTLADGQSARLDAVKARLSGL